MQILDPAGIVPRGVEYVHWKSASSRHPDSFSEGDITDELITAIQNSRQPPMETIGFLKMSHGEPCTVNGKESPCFLFARKFLSGSVQALHKMKHVLGY